MQHARLSCPSPSPGVHPSSPEFMSIESVMPSNHLIPCHHLLLLPSIYPSIRVFSNELVAHIRWQSIGASASALVLPVNIQGWFPLGSCGLILQSKGLSRVFSNTTVQKHQFFGAQLSSESTTLTSIHDYWKNHSFDYMHLCWQNDVCCLMCCLGLSKPSFQEASVF